MGNRGILIRRAEVVEISLAELIAAPLEAAADAQFNLARSTLEFITSIGLQKDGDGKEIAKTLSFDMRTPDMDISGKNRVSIQVPLLSIIPVTSLAVEEVNVAFQMEITSVEKSSRLSKLLGSKDSVVSFSGKISPNAANTRETNQSAKYQIQIKVCRFPQSEGLCRLLDLLTVSVQGK